MGDYDKPLTDEERKAVSLLAVFHPDLLNPKYFEIEKNTTTKEWDGFDDEEEDDFYYCESIDNKVDEMRMGVY